MGSEEYHFWHAPLRVRRFDDSPENYDMDAWLKTNVADAAGKWQFMVKGKRSSRPAFLPELPGRKDWVVETSRRYPMADESMRRWSILARFATRDDAVNYCKRWREAEAWLIAREDAGARDETIFFNPINEQRRLRCLYSGKIR